MEGSFTVTVIELTSSSDEADKVSVVEAENPKNGSPSNRKVNGQAALLLPPRIQEPVLSKLEQPSSADPNRKNDRRMRSQDVEEKVTRARHKSQVSRKPNDYDWYPKTYGSIASPGSLLPPIYREERRLIYY